MVPVATRGRPARGSAGGRLNERLLDLLLANDHLAELEPPARRLALRSLLAPKVSEDELAALVAEVADSIDHFGPLSPLMRDDAVTDVLVNGPFEVWVERGGALQRTGIGFSSDAELRALIDRLLAEAGTRADVSKPLADARLRDGSRINVALPPVAPDGPLVSIRRFPPEPPTLNDLAATRMLGADEANRLARAVRSGISMWISGRTGTGKTTLLGALLGEVPAHERVVLIEETPELRPRGHHVSLVARPANVEGKGRVELAELVRAALRMRPDRIVVGEARGPEALDALTALSTGHDGSLLTLHARSAADAPERIVSMALSASSGASEAALRNQVAGAFGLGIHLERDPDGLRRVAHIADGG